MKELPLRTASTTSAVAIALAFVLGCSSGGEATEEGFTPSGSIDGGGDAGAAGSGGSGGSGGGPTGGSGASGGSGGGSTGGTGGSGGSSGGSAGGAGSAGTSGAAGTSGTAGSSGAAGSGGAAGAAGSGGSGGSGGGTSCSDLDEEPNDDEGSPQVLDTINDCDSNGTLVNGTLEGGADRDWFTFRGEDSFGCSVNPNFELYSPDDAELCAYFICDTGGDNVTCPSDATDDTSPDGIPGCCTTTKFLEVELDCQGMDDTSQVYFVVNAPDNTGCQLYDVQYHY